jgi:hypothetical protein
LDSTLPMESATFDESKCPDTTKVLAHISPRGAVRLALRNWFEITDISNTPNASCLQFSP